MLTTRRTFPFVAPLTPAAVGLFVLGGCLLGCSSRASSSLAPHPLRPPFDAATAPIERGIDLEHLALDLAFDWEAQRVHGSATLWLRSLRPGLTSVQLEASDFTIREVLDARGRALVTRHSGDVLEVELLAPLDRGVEEQLRVVYAVSPTRGLRFGEAAGPGPTFRPEFHGTGRHPGAWFPVPAGPADRATVELRARVPLDLEVVASGTPRAVEEHGRGERTFVWATDSAISPEHFGVAAARFVRHTGEAQSAGRAVPVRLHVPEGLEPDAVHATLADAGPALTLFAARLGVPYPFPRLDVVVVEGLGIRGLEAAGLVLIDRSLLLEPGTAGDDVLDAPRRTVVHEVAHQWFGVGVAPLGPRERWLVEAFATWMELEYEAHVGGAAHAELLFEELRSELLEGRPGHGTHGTELSPVVYTLGPWVLRKLGGELGDEPLWRAAEALWGARGGDFATTEDLRRAVLDVTGHDPAAFLERWVDGPGVPCAEVFVEGSGRELSVRAEAVGDSPWPLAIEMQIRLEDGSRSHLTLDLASGRSTTVASFPAPVVDVVVDPRGRSWADFDVRKPDGMWVRQFSDPPSASAALRALSRVVRISEEDGEWGADARSALLAAPLRRPEAGLRLRGIEVLPGSDVRTVPVLLQVVGRDPDARVRRAALRALRQLHARGEFEPDDATRKVLFDLHHAERASVVLEAFDALLEVIG